MDISHIQVIARVQRSEQLNSLSEPRLIINHENEEPVIIVENAEGEKNNVSNLLEEYSIPIKHCRSYIQLFNCRCFFRS